VVDCLEFVAAHNLSLPSEAQWEYAARAGSDRASYTGLARCAWFSNSSDGVTHPVGLLEANAFGLHDMLGNVSEIFADSQHRDYNGAPNDGSAWTDSHVKRRMQRGGHFNVDHTRIRAACRTSIASDQSRSHAMGFRPVRVMP
jgi:formylglycine-generating enzyme required for sulfatase activity